MKTEKRNALYESPRFSLFVVDENDVIRTSGEPEGVQDGGNITVPGYDENNMF